MERTTEGRPPTVRLAPFAVAIAIATTLALAGSRHATAGPVYAVNVHGFTFSAAAANELGAPLGSFTYIVNLDNSGDATAADANARPSLHFTESHSDLLASGDQTASTFSLPAGRYLISMRSPGHRLWGKQITLPADAGDVNVALRSTPAPLGKLVVQVFRDDHYTNSAPDEGETGLAGFKVLLTEQTGLPVTVDYNNVPLCGGDCVTGPDGSVTIPNLSPATYNIAVRPPQDAAHDWVQTTTIYGGPTIPATVSEGSNGTGLGGEGGWADPNLNTSYWFGFVDANTRFSVPGTATVIGNAYLWRGWPPYDQLEIALDEPVANAYVALSDTTTNQVVDVAQADAAGHFDITGVPAGDYNVAIWDEQMSYIMRFLTLTVPAGQPDGTPVDMGDIGVARWFGWLGGTVYWDLNNNGIQDPGEPGIPNFPADIRWRDGSIADETKTGPDGSYLYPQAEGGYLGKWTINETGFDRFGTNGSSVHDEHYPNGPVFGDPNPRVCATTQAADPGCLLQPGTSIGGGLLNSQLVTEGHRSIVDWGHYQYTGTQTGQIVGIVYYATTRNEFEASLQAHENYEPGIPGVTVNLEARDGTILNTYVTDRWSPPTNCVYTDMNGTPSPFEPPLNPLIQSLCLEVPITGNQTKDGAFDGGYAFAQYCPNGMDVTSDPPPPDATPCWNAAHTGHEALADLVPGEYVTHVLMPKDANGGDLYRIVKEEDVNVDLGTQYVPAIPPPPCYGADHVIDQTTLTPRSVHYGHTAPADPLSHARLCDKKLVDLQPLQNANADFHVMTNFKNGQDPAVPGRIVGLVTDNVYFERDIQSIWYGEPRPVPNIPVGIYDYANRLLTTIQSDMYGSFETIVPSTETFNCPIPQGPCPGIYYVKINDPGSKDHPNANYNPKYLGQTLEWDVWPGQTSQMDIPIAPVAGSGCTLPTGTPELFQMSKVVVEHADAGTARQILIQGDFFGTAAGSVTLADSTAPARALGARTLTVANGGIASWSNYQILVNVPADGATFFPGPKQLTVKLPGASGLSTLNGITIHVKGPTPPLIPAATAPPYQPAVVNVADPTSDAHALQNAIDGAAPGSIVVLAPGVYRENVILWKPLKLQGRGTGGLIGINEAPNVPADDPRKNIQGTVVDGRFFSDVEAAWVQKLGSLAFSGDRDVSRGADITVVAPETGANSFAGYTGMNAARIDGLGIQLGRGRAGAGGIQVHAYGRNLQLTNNIVEHDTGAQGGGINLGAAYASAPSHNENIAVKWSRIVGSGGMKFGGGVTVFTNADNYEIANNTLCSDFSNEYGGGISHHGKSPGGWIHDNRIYYNDSVDSGSGIAITEEVPANADIRSGLGAGTGAVTVERNIIQSNFAGDDGGGVWVQSAYTSRVLLRNNMLNANGAADSGGGIALGDSSNVALVNNTVADNITTGTYPGITRPHGAGLAVHANSPSFQPVPTAPTFSDPAVMLNNIFWNNLAYLPDRATMTLASVGVRDFEVENSRGGVATFANARYNLFTDGQVLDFTGAFGPVLPGGPADAQQLAATQGNLIGVNPLFVTPVPPATTLASSARDPQQFAVTLVPADQPLGGNYHLQRSFASGALDRGVRCSNFTPPLPPATIASVLQALTGTGPACPAGAEVAPSGANADIDGDSRAQTIVQFPPLGPLTILPRPNRLWDFGADEVRLIP